MVRSLSAITGSLALLLVISLPFSIALNSIALVLIAVWIVIFWIFFPGYRNQLQGNRIELNWLSIPFVYAISVLYSANFDRGINQFLNLTPVLLLPLFFIQSTIKNWLELLSKAYTASILLVSLINILSIFQILPLDSKETTVSSLFHDAEKTSFIIWSGILLGCRSSSSSRFWLWTTPLLFINLFYYGHIVLIFMASSTYLLLQLLPASRQRPDMVSRILIFGTFIIILSLVYFNTFRTHLADAMFNLVAIYTNEAWTSGMSGFLIDLKFSFIQWIKHPFTGVGLGDYLDAIWNEYRDHGKEAPGYPYSQLMHILVSCGAMTFWVVWVLISSWIKYSRNRFLFFILIASILVFAAPFKSQVTATAFMLAVILGSSPDEKD